MNHISRPVRYIALSILAAVLFSVSGCNKERKKLVLSKYDGPYSDVNGSYGGVDDLGRELLTDTEAGGVRQGKTVGIFYFLCLGTQDTNHVYDVQKILEKDPTAYRSEEAWLSAGGGAAGASLVVRTAVQLLYADGRMGYPQAHSDVFCCRNRLSDAGYLKRDAKHVPAAGPAFA